MGWEGSELRVLLIARVAMDNLIRHKMSIKNIHCVVRVKSNLIILS